MYQGQQGQAPIFILKEGTQRTRGRTAQSNNIAAAKAVADAVRSTLGPKGMDKMLVDSIGDVVITNDGATILKEMDIEHPAAKMIIEVAKTGISSLMVEQNARQALEIADKGYVLVQGRNAYTDTGEALLANPEVRRTFLGG